MDWLATAIALAVIALFIIATVLMIRHREQARKATRVTEHLNVIPNDTRRAFWTSSADHSGTSGGSSSIGEGDGD